jgi:hypothetical protein
MSCSKDFEKCKNNGKVYPIFTIKLHSKVDFHNPDVPTIKHLSGKGKVLLGALFMSGIESILCFLI